MPELPEVETIKRQLKRIIVDKKFTRIEINLPKIIKTPLNNFKRVVSGSIIKNVERRAKLLIIELSNGYSLLIHLKMTGQLVFYPATSSPSVIPAKAGIQYEGHTFPEVGRRKSRHTHLIFHFSDKSRLLYNDLRQFGYVKIVSAEKVKELLNKEYGPEPLEKNFTINAFRKLLKKKPRAKIKQFLMDQKNIAGIGNLYADEILFFAGIMPTRKISTLANNEIKKIYVGIKKILTEAIKYHGSSVDNYLDARGKAGKYHLRLKVYGRKNEKCFKCSGKVQKIKLAGRGTHFCPKCQK